MNASLLCFALFAQTPPLETLDIDTFKWLDSLGYRQALDKPFVRVDMADKQYRGSRSMAYGFLVADGKDSFEVLLPNLATITYGKSEDTNSFFFPRCTYVPADFSVYARTMTRYLDSEAPFMDDENWPSHFLGYGITISFAWICHTKGFENEAARFLKESRRMREPRPTLQQRKDDVAGGVYSDLVQSFENPSLTRADLLARFQAFAKTYAGTKQGTLSLEAVRILERMVVEDKERAKHPIDPESLSGEKKIAALIELLRDETLNSMNSDKSASYKLAEIGYPAVPQLLDALKDTRFTRTIFHPMSGPPVTYTHRGVSRIWNSVEDILARIANRSFDADYSNDRAKIEKQARAWWASYKHKGEREVLLEGVRKADRNSPGQAHKLAESYPEVAFPAIRDAFPRMQDQYGKTSMIDALRPLKAQEVTGFVRKIVRESGGFEVRFAAAKILAGRDPEAAIAAVQLEWTRLAKGNPEYISSDSICQFLLESGRSSAVRFLAKDLAKRSPGERFEVLSQFTRGLDNWNLYFPQEAVLGGRENRDEYIEAVEDMLAAELHDRDVWPGSMSGGDLSFNSPELCEIATYVLSMCFPDRYKFTKTNSMAEREKQRVASLNVYRKSRGVKPVAYSYVPPVRFLPESELQPLIDKLIATGDGAPLRAKGLPAMRAIQARLDRMDNKSSGYRRLLAVGQSVSCIVRALTSSNAKWKTEAALVRQAKKFEKATLTSSKLFDLIVLLSKDISKGKVRPATFLLRRDSEGTGITVDIRFSDAISQGSESVMLNGSSIRSTGGGDAGSYLHEKKFDEYIGSGVRRCLTSAPNVPFEISIQLAAPYRQT